MQDIEHPSGDPLLSVQKDETYKKVREEIEKILNDNLKNVEKTLAIYRKY
jgi:hypothetical protein